MKTKKIKLALIELILKEEDEIVLLAIKNILDKKFPQKNHERLILEKPTENLLIENSNEIIGYDADGKALNLTDYNEAIEKGLEDIKNKRFISQQNLEKEIEGW